MHPQIHVRACLLVVQNGKILLVPHFDTDEGPVQYNVPGGKVEYGETLQEAAIREFREETGYDAVTNGLLDIYEHRRPGWHSITIGFLGTITGGDLRAEQTPWGQRMPRWCSPGELSSVPHHPAPLITKALNTATA